MTYTWTINVVLGKLERETSSRLVATAMLLVGLVIALLAALAMSVVLVWAVNAMLEAGRLDVLHVFAILATAVLFLRR